MYMCQDFMCMQHSLVLVDCKMCNIHLPHNSQYCKHCKQYYCCYKSKRYNLMNKLSMMYKMYRNCYFHSMASILPADQGNNLSHMYHIDFQYLLNKLNNWSLLQHMPNKFLNSINILGYKANINYFPGYYMLYNQLQLLHKQCTKFRLSFQCSHYCMFSIMFIP